MSENPHNALLAAVRWNSDGLVPAVAQDARTGQVLMLAWMNAEAIMATLRDGLGTYWSRSRQAFLFLIAIWGNWLRLRGKLNASELRKRPWFLRAVVFSAFLPYLAIWCGWWTREVGRQPWVVNGRA